MGEHMTRKYYCDHECGLHIDYDSEAMKFNEFLCPKCEKPVKWELMMIPVDVRDMTPHQTFMKVADSVIEDEPLSDDDQDVLAERMARLNQNFGLFQFVQTVREMDGLKKIMSALNLVQERLYDKQVLASLDPDDLMKMHSDLNKAKEKAQEFIIKSVKGDTPAVFIDNRTQIANVTGLSAESREKLRKVIGALEIIEKEDI